MKKQSSKKRKIFSCLALFFSLIAIGSSSQAASRKLYFALANNFASQCNPDYLSNNQGTGSPTNYNYGKKTRPKLNNKITDINLPSFSVDNTFYTSAVNLQETNCNGLIYQNYQPNLLSLFYDISEWRFPTSQIPLVTSPMPKGTDVPQSESVSEIPVPGAIWLFVTAMVGIYGLRKPRLVKV
ncbi:hypothetical protein MCAMS1_00002 [biofilm metagenome]